MEKTSMLVPVPGRARVSVELLSDPAHQPGDCCNDISLMANMLATETIDHICVLTRPEIGWILSASLSTEMIFSSLEKNGSQP